MDEAQGVVRTAYGRPNAQAEPLKKGVINSTFLVIDGDQKYILQRMNGMFPTVMMTDFVTVTDHLTAQGWEVPQVIRTINQQSYYQAPDQSWWRLMSFIHSDPAMPVMDKDEYRQIGGLLARMHADLAALNYRPAFTLPHFHETTYYADRLQAVLHDFTDPDLRIAAETMLKHFKTLVAPVELPQQLIHGDPQTSNVLFKNGQPFTFIDFDTIMVADIWTDLGDMLRALIEDALEHSGVYPAASLAAAIDGYYAHQQLPLDQSTFTEGALRATQRIALELGMRFMTDVVEDRYFGFEPHRFSSRLESNSHRGRRQLEIYQLCEEHL